MEKLVSISIDSPKERKKESVTSANVLCKYMQKPKFLYEILENMAIKPRYVPEIIRFYGVDSLDSISIPMVCFCDIPLSKIAKHSVDYGTYGIALDKEMCSTKNVQPVTYINETSSYYRDFSETISKLYLTDESPDEKWKFLTSFILTQMLYSKPVYGESFEDGERIKKLFKDECEWRYIPKLPDDLDTILINKKNTQKGRDLYNAALAKEDNKSTWLSFAPSEISYLIVPDETAAIELIDFINSMDSCEEQTRYRLISKIEILSKIQKNFV